VRFKIKRGLDIPLAGAPDQSIHPGPRVRSVAVVGLDYVGLRAALDVSVGDRVRAGQRLFTDKKNPGIPFVAPGTGEVVAIKRGDRRALQGVVIRLDVRAEAGGSDYQAYGTRGVAGLDRQRVQDQLIASGLWTAFRTRPYRKIPLAGAVPAAIFVTAMDTRPLAPDPQVIISEQADAFAAGLTVLPALTEGTVFLCHGPGVDYPRPDHPRLVTAEFEGPHPAGLAGTHIHFLAPVDASRTVWTVGYQDVIAIGHLFLQGVLWTERVVALAGPMVRRPRLVRTRLGAAIGDLLVGELPNVECRVISGSVLDGRRVAGMGGYLGRYHNQASVLAEGRHRELFGWIKPGFDKFSAANVFASSLFGRGRRFAWIYCRPNSCAHCSWVTTRQRRSSAAWSWTRKTWPCAHSCAPASTTLARCSAAGSLSSRGPVDELVAAETRCTGA
jgi:Na+-transporting NADH:ubiquinone oxidoreductase subunit A